MDQWYPTENSCTYEKKDYSVEIVRWVKTYERKLQYLLDGMEQLQVLIEVTGVKTLVDFKRVFDLGTRIMAQLNGYLNVLDEPVWKKQEYLSHLASCSTEFYDQENFVNIQKWESSHTQMVQKRKKKGLIVGAVVAASGALLCSPPGKDFVQKRIELMHHTIDDQLTELFGENYLPGTNGEQGIIFEKSTPINRSLAKKDWK